MCVQLLRFQWDEGKNAANRRKHGVSFDEAQTVFYDDWALLVSDPEHSASEERFVLLGLSSKVRIVLVCHCYREKDEVIRIISARRANPSERREYEERRSQ